MGLVAANAAGVHQVIGDPDRVKAWFSPWPIVAGENVSTPEGRPLQEFFFKGHLTPEPSQRRPSGASRRFVTAEERVYMGRPVAAQELFSQLRYGGAAMRNGGQDGVLTFQ